MPDAFTLETFLPLRGDAFRVQMDADTSIEAQLVEASAPGTPSGAPPASGGRDAFTLVFRFPPVRRPVQRIYRLEHPRLGAFELFLVPVGPDDRGMRYEAVFS